jgi:hypothetical protein
LLKQNKYYYLLLGIVALVMLAMNWLTTLKGDEYVYALIPGDIVHHCNTVSDYVRSIPAFYQGTNGRLADATERLFASLVGKPMFNVLNMLMFVLFIEGIFTLAVGRRRSVLALSMVLVCVAFFFPYPGETLLWMAGSFNYLWSASISLWLVCWLKYCTAPQGVHSNSFLRGLGGLLCGLIAGWFNESTSLGVLLGLCLYFALNRREFTSLRRRVLLGYVVGLVIIMASPALWLRLSGGASVNTSLSVLQMVSRRILSLGYMSLRFLTPAIAVIVLFHVWHRQGGLRAIVRRTELCLLLGTMCAAILLGMVIERPYTWLVTVSMVVCLRAFWPTMSRWPVTVLRVVTVACLVACCVGSGMALHKMWIYRNYDQGVQQQIADGPRQCILKASHAPISSRWILPDVYDNDTYHCAYRTIYSCYYDKDNVQFLPPTIYERYVAGTLLEGAETAPFTSSDPSLADTLLTIDGAPYALVSLKSGIEGGNGNGKVFRTDIEEYWGSSTSQRRYWLGSLKEFVPCRPYFLVIDGHTYEVVGCEVPETVTRIELKVYISGKWRLLTFTRNNNAS